MGKRKRSQRALSKVEAIAGVITLVVVVASLFMLKGKFVFDEADTAAEVDSAADSTSQVADSSTDRTRDLPPTSPKEVLLAFSPGSAKLPAGAEDTLAPLVAALRDDGALNAVLRADPAGAPAELVRTRVDAVRHALEADGISAARVVIDAPAGPGIGFAGAATVRIELRER